MVNLRIFMVVCLCWFLSGCSTGHHSMYSESRVDKSQIAIIKGGPNVTLHEIDGKPGPNFGGDGLPKMYNSAFDRNFHIELPPGPHVVKLFYLEGNRNYRIGSTIPIVLTIETEPGGIYIIEPTLSDQKWAPKVLRIK